MEWLLILVLSGSTFNFGTYDDENSCIDAAKQIVNKTPLASQIYTNFAKPIAYCLPREKEPD